MEEREHRGRRMRVSIRTRAMPEQVWQAWTDPEKLAHWFVDRARGRPEVGATFSWIFEKFGYEIPYEVVAAEPNARFALGGEAPGSGPFLLEITIATEAGETLVTLVNSGFLDGSRWDEEFEGILSGWTMALAALKLYLDRHFGKPKTAVLILRPANYRYDRLLPYYATSQGLGRWLTTSAAIGGLGEPCELQLAGGGSVTGRMLAKTRWEAAYGWDELDGMLELKGFRFPGEGKVVGARVLSWSLPPEGTERIERRLGLALEKLAAAIGSEESAREGAR